MKSQFEINQTIKLLIMTSRTNLYAKIEIQALQWARRTMQSDPLHAENLILNRIARLQLKQESKEIMGFATKPARAKQINALRWVINEMEIDHFEPA